MKQEKLFDLFGELDAGVFLNKVARGLADVALGAVTTNKPGKVILTFDLKQIGTSNQVHIKHAIKMIKPTPNGKVTEENSTETPVYVGVGGTLSALPEKQEPLFKGSDAPAKE
ncbi:hypothetical protein SAMN04487785_102424 [Dyella jiangningensis]|uniref:hypothetical protein n=1 Tax=Dyella sp. AtDHG13 TaxID=1938897 RepID=UPI00088EEB1A|nr:hypothetical protein [Dyella sp. AtDHG13]PXV60696.1 hypothetical protein BDW41_102423 [Dyella sp. AtDHG13]SDJ55524.1 hypothetical protein SAMN04487785_102424 [Dyella jiangningensis]